MFKVVAVVKTTNVHAYTPYTHLRMHFEKIFSEKPKTLHATD